MASSRTEDNEEESLFVGDDEVETYHGDAQTSSATNVIQQNITLKSTIEGSRKTRPVTLSVKLPFQQRIITDMLAEDGLLILGRGLGFMSIAVNVIHALDVAGTDPEDKENSLVIVVGTHDGDNERIQEELRDISLLDNIFGKNGADDRLGSSRTRRSLTVVNDKMDSKKRSAAYKRGGVFSVTSRIMVVDMLSGAVDCGKITGIVVLHAQEVKPTSNIEFVLRLFRQSNRNGFIKALSDEPEKFTSGFSPLATHMKSLHLQRVWLWPRFHVQITDTLNSFQRSSRRAINGVQLTNNKVIEIQVEMTDAMREIQTAIRECIEACLSQIKKSNPQLETENWIFDNALHRDFTQMIRFQLDPIWHLISWRTRQIVSDLGELVHLLESLTVRDSVSFMRDLDLIRISNVNATGLPKEPSPWLLLDAAQLLFRLGKERVFGNVTPGASGDYIEELPKYDQLAQLLHEVAGTNEDGTTGPILVMCNRAHTAIQLTNYLTRYNPGDPDSTQKFMKERRNWLIDWRKGITSVKNYLQANVKVDEELPNPSKGKENSTISEKKRSSGDGQANNSEDSRRNGFSKRRRVRGGANVNVGMRQRAEDEDDDEDLSIYLVEGIPASQTLDIDNIEEAQNDAIDGDFNILSDNASAASIAVMKKCVLVQYYDDQNDDYLLSELSPSHIIMYEPNPSFVRRVEIYRANMAAVEPEDSPKNNINVYFMHYRDSVEEQRYLSSVRREKDAFTRLIREKATMPIQLGHDDDGDADGEENSSSLLRTVTSRIAGGQIFATVEKPRVIIDAREFRSSLPSLLHAKGFQLVPITLKVGDYILTPDVCVERKSISDLISSLNSGRLMEQCENMVKYYDLPTLLIEFSEAKSFSMEPFSDNAVSQESARMSQENIQQKLTVLFLHFPKLKVIWSPSPHQTAEIIATLKSGRKEPDVELSKRYGADEDKSNLIGNENDTAISVLRSIPGITFQNYQLIISQVPNIKALCGMSEDEIAELIGREAARKVVRFLERNLRE